MPLLPLLVSAARHQTAQTRLGSSRDRAARMSETLSPFRRRGHGQHNDERDQPRAATAPLIGTKALETT